MDGLFPIEQWMVSLVHGLSSPCPLVVVVFYCCCCQCSLLLLLSVVYVFLPCSFLSALIIFCFLSLSLSFLPSPSPSSSSLFFPLLLFYSLIALDSKPFFLPSPLSSLSFSSRLLLSFLVSSTRPNSHIHFHSIPFPSLNFVFRPLVVLFTSPFVVHHSSFATPLGCSCP
ncbi:hypothetical protein BKA57DRAFT_133172 [Linnemannia elongata]|nr:hypothetical protein BKA57DRAFT_133172 [Linnemannia elongata]